MTVGVRVIVAVSVGGMVLVAVYVIVGVLVSVGSDVMVLVGVVVLEGVMVTGVDVEEAWVTAFSTTEQPAISMIPVLIIKKND